MSTEPSTSRGTPPVFSDPESKLAIWERSSQSGTEFYALKDESGENPRFVTIWKNIAGYELSPNEAAALYEGFSIVNGEDQKPLLCVSKSGNPYSAALFSKGVVSKPRTVGERTFENETLEVGIALQRFSARGVCNGYTIDDVDYKRFFKIGEGQFAELTAADCHALSKGEKVETEGYEFAQDGIEERKSEPTGRIYKNAKVGFTAVASIEEAPEAASQLPANVEDFEPEDSEQLR